MKWPWKKDLRGKHPNSLATLAQLNAERRAAKREAEAALNPLPPPRAPPPTPAAYSPMSTGPIAQFFNDMQAMETWKQQVYELEVRKRGDIAAQVRESIMQELNMKGDVDPPDLVTDKAMEFLLDIVKQKMQPGTIGTTPMAITPENPGIAPLEQAQADQIADHIEEKYSDLCKQARAGTLSKEAAIKLLTDNDLLPAHAEQVYQSIMDVEEDGTL